MAFKLTWHGHEPYEGLTHTFAPGESRYFESREHIPAEMLMDYRFRAVSVPHDEAFPHDVIDEVLVVAKQD